MAEILEILLAAIAAGDSQAAKLALVQLTAHIDRLYTAQLILSICGIAIVGLCCYTLHKLREQNRRLAALEGGAANVP